MMPTKPRLLLVLALAASASAAHGSAQFLLVTDAAADTVRKYDLQGNYLGAVFDQGAGGLDSPLGMTLAPDGSLLVSGDLSGDVHRYDLETGASLGVFADFAGMRGPAGMEVRDGRLWVSDGRSGRVFRFDAHTGGFLDTFAAGLIVPEAIVFDNNGEVLIGDFWRNEFRRYNEQTGAQLGFAVRGQGLNRPLHAKLSDDGSQLFTANLAANTITVHDLETGLNVRTIDLRNNGARMSGPVDWVTLDDGSHIVTSTNTGTLLRYDADWNYIDVFATGNNIRAGAIMLVPTPGAALVLMGAPLLAARRRR